MPILTHKYPHTITLHTTPDGRIEKVVVDFGAGQSPKTYLASKEHVGRPTVYDAQADVELGNRLAVVAAEYGKDDPGHAFRGRRWSGCRRGRSHEKGGPT